LILLKQMQIFERELVLQKLGSWLAVNLDSQILKNFAVNFLKLTCLLISDLRFKFELIFQFLFPNLKLRHSLDVVFDLDFQYVLLTVVPSS
jgi:hypothetical protein